MGTFTTRPIQPMPLQEAIASTRGPWRLHAGEDVILQEGCVAHIEAHGRDRCRRIRQAAAIESGDAVWMGGLAFDDEHEATGAWSRFPAASFCLPKRQLRWHAGGLFETTCDAPSRAHEASVGGGLPETSKEEWLGAVEQAQRAISEGEILKVVLARCTRSPTVDVRHDLLRLMAAERGIAFAYDHGAAFYGVSPERLVHLQDGLVRTHALAGSAASGAAKHLLESPKEALEHDLVAAFVHRRLEAAGVDGIEAQERRVRTLAHVQHLETPMSGRAAAGTHVLDLVAALHPTPAVCGTPPHRSMELIRRLEGFPRGWYAGAVGWFDARGQGEFAVALRCALQTDSRYLFSGAGIVAGSEAQAEWDETETKLATLREAA